MQILLMRLPKHEPRQLAAWLQKPADAPRLARRTLRLLLELEKRRQELSSCWQGFFKSSLSGFAVTEAEASPEPQTVQWTGLAACAGTIEGNYRYLAEPYGPPPSQDQESVILIFGKARPETVSFFPGASAVLYAEGGLLSHACCVAREQGLPCVTALGRGFLASVRARPSGHLRLESTASTGLGQVRLLPGN
jgi:phosphohistidine swiveling domain-containing protein